MANPTTLPGDLIVPGNARITGTITPAKDKSDVLSVETKTFHIPWSWWRIWNDDDAVLPGAAAADDLGFIAGAFSSASPSIQSVDFGGTTTTAYARCQIPLPPDYVAGQSVVLRFHAGQIVVADTTCTLDMSAYKSDEELGIGSDLASAASANNIKSATLADVDFTITATGLSPGDVLDVRISVTGDDSGNADDNITAVIGAIQLIYGGR